MYSPISEFMTCALPVATDVVCSLLATNYFGRWIEEIGYGGHIIGNILFTLRVYK